MAAQDVLHVGDDAALDVEGAANAGMQTAWLNWNHRSWDMPHLKPHLTVQSLTQLCEALR